MPAQFWEAVLNSPVQTAAGTALATSTTLTDVSPLPSLVLPANFLYPGQVLKISAFGVYSTTSAPTLLLGAYYGGVAGVALAATGAITAGTTQTNMTWFFECLTVIRTVGASGTAISAGSSRLGLTSTTVGGGMAPASGMATVTIDTTAAKALTIGAQWGTSSASNTLTCHGMTVEAMN